MDASGRIVVPKAVREAAGFAPGTPLRVSYRDGRIEIEPAPREVRIVERGGFRVAEPVARGTNLTAETVRETRKRLRDRSR
jgi:AbrB family looped-hinge helix DNA binding protein